MPTPPNNTQAYALLNGRYFVHSLSKVDQVLADELRRRRMRLLDRRALLVAEWWLDNERVFEAKWAASDTKELEE